MISSNMGNGTKFKLSRVVPNVLSKIKGLRSNNSSVRKLASSSPSVTSECAASDLDQKDFSVMSRECSASDIDRKDFSITPRDAHVDHRSSSPKRGSPQNRNGHARHTSMPALITSNGHESICHPAESPLRSKGSNKSGSLSPPPPRSQGSTEIVDPGCCSFDSSMALVPHDGRVRNNLPFTEVLHGNGSNLKNRIHSRSHSRTRSAQLEGSSSCEEYGLPSIADERASHRSGKVSVRRRSSYTRDQNVEVVDQTHQLYPRADHSRNGSSDCLGSGRLLNSSRERTDLDRHEANGSSARNGGRLSEKVSAKVVNSDGNDRRGHHRLRSTSTLNYVQRHICGGNQDTDLDYTPGERNHHHAKALLCSEIALANTVLNASNGWEQDQLRRFGHGDEKPRWRASYDSADSACKGDSESADDREATLVKTVLSTQGWERENLNANEHYRQPLARLSKAGSVDILVRRGEEAADAIEYEAFGLNPDSRAFFSWRSSRHPSPASEEAEKYTEGRVDYKSSVHEEFAQPVVDYASSDLYKGARTGKSGKEFGNPWDTEFPSFRSDSILMGGGIGSDRTSYAADERAARIDYKGCGSPAALSRRYLEQERQSKIKGVQQQDSSRCGKISTRSHSRREEVTSNAASGLRNSKASSQSASPRLSSPRLSSAELSGRPKLSPTPIQEFSNGKKIPSQTPSPRQEVKGARRSAGLTSSSIQDFQQVKSKSSLSPPPNQSAQAGGKPLTAQAEAGMQRLDSVAVVKASYDPYQDFRVSMVEMILENDIRTSQDLEDLLQCYLSLNSSEYRKTIVEVFTDVWEDIFDQ